MSKYTDPEAGQLPLPSPRSPAQLDERILSAAREHAPTPKRFRQPLWLGAAATASMLIVAVFIALPQQPSPLLGEKKARAIEVDTERSGNSIKQLRFVDSLGIAREEESVQDMPAQHSAVNSKPALGPALLTEQIQTLSDLLQAGEEERASEQYSELKKRCADCDLPDTLEQAIGQYLDVR